MNINITFTETDCETIDLALASIQEEFSSPYIKGLISRLRNKKNLNSKDICIVYEALILQSSNCEEICKTLAIPEQFRFVILKSNSEKLIKKLKPIVDEAEKMRL